MPSSKSDKKFLKELKRKEMKRKRQKEKKKSKRRCFCRNCLSWSVGVLNLEINVQVEVIK